MHVLLLKPHVLVVTDSSSSTSAIIYFLVSKRTIKNLRAGTTEPASHDEELHLKGDE